MDLEGTSEKPLKNAFQKHPVLIDTNYGNALENINT